ncbi:MAG: germination protein Ger(X)C family, partial [Eubacterium sp.]|nr:germination protein Ger(X)C family [Eubacterium sp.]
MKKRVLLLLLVCLINIITCTGCWNYREIDKMSIVAGVAIDKTPEGKYKITAEIIDLHEGGREAKINSRKLESYGYSMFEAIRNTLKITSNKLYWGHMEIVILSQEVAKEGIVTILDFLERDAEPRLSVDLLVSKEKTAEEILDCQSITTEIRSFEINNMLDTEKFLSKTPKVQIYEFINALSAEGLSPVLPTVSLIENDGKKTSELTGTAVFRKDKLEYMFDEEETKFFLYVIDKIKGGTLNLGEGIKQGQTIATLEIMNNKTKVKPVYSKGKLSVDIEIETKAELEELSEQKKTYDTKQNKRLEIEASKT